MDNTDIYNKKYSKTLWGTFGETSAFRIIDITLRSCVPKWYSEKKGNFYSGADWWTLDM